MGREVHGADPEVVRGGSQQRPPHHALVDVDAPGQQRVAHHERVPQRLQHHVVVVLAACRNAYRLAM